MSKQLEQFSDILEGCENKLRIKQKQYKNSWEIMSFHDLRVRLWEEIDKWSNLIYDNDKDQRNETEEQGTDEIEELIDIINIALMLSERINRVYIK